MADLIERGKLLEYIDDNFYPTTVSCYMTAAEARAARERHNMFIDAINNAPAVDAVATGRAEWDILVSKNINDYWQADMACPLCGFIKMNIWSGFFPNIDAETARRVTMEYAKRCKKPNFCEKCGADLREVKKDG